MENKMMWNRIIGIIACGICLQMPTAALAQSGAKGAPSVRPAPQTVQYTHPIRKFTIAVPPGEKVVPRGDRHDLMIQSRRGYVISIQVDDRNQSIDLARMVGKLESQELGKGKRWSTKSGQRVLSIHGLPAYDAIYEGSNIRTRTVIVRGGKTDFVMMFVAAPQAFPTHANIFDWVILNFRPSADEMVGAKMESTIGNLPPKKQQPMHDTKRQAMMLPKKASKAELKHYGGPLEGFSLKYPSTWVAANPSASSVYFSGPKGTESYYTLIGVRTLRPEARGPKEAVRKVIQSIKTEISAAAQELRSLGEGGYEFKGNGFVLQGREMILSYKLHNQVYRKWSLILPSGVGDTVLAWSFTAPSYLFDKNLPMARKVRDSWYIHAPRKQGN
jgi:hypothetical protein